MQIIRSNEATAGYRTAYFRVWNTDGTPKTDLTAATAKLYLHNAIVGNTSANFAHLGEGWYSVVLTQSEVNVTAGQVGWCQPDDASGYIIDPLPFQIGPATSFTPAATDYATASAQTTMQGDVTAIKESVDTEIASIISTLTTISGKIDTVDDLLDTEVAAIKTVVDAMKVKTDQLVFTKTNELDVNVQSQNGATVLGTGVVGDKWRGS